MLVAVNFLTTQNLSGQNGEKLRLFGLILVAYANPIVALIASLLWDVYIIAGIGKQNTEETNPNPIEQFYAADLGLDLN